MPLACRPRAIDEHLVPAGIIGLAMIGLVIFLEQRRQQIPLWIDEVRERLESWD